MPRNAVKREGREGLPADIKAKLETMLDVQRILAGRAYAWTPEGGLEPAVIETVEGWIKTQALVFVATGERRGLDLDDLIQAGSLGALTCAAFQPRRPVETPFNPRSGPDHGGAFHLGALLGSFCCA